MMYTRRVSEAFKYVYETEQKLNGAFFNPKIDKRDRPKALTWLSASGSGATFPCKYIKNK